MADREREHRLSTGLRYSGAAAMLRIPLLLLVALAVSVGLSELSAAQSPTALGVDVVPAGNTSSLVGAVDSCVEVEVGDRFQVDLYVEGTQELRAWELRFAFDHDVVQILEGDYDYDLFLLSTSPSGSVFPSLLEMENPDRYFLAAAEFRGTPDSGSGVLARLTMEAVAPGRSPAAIVTQSYYAPRLSDAHGSELFMGPVSQAEVAVGEPCLPGGPRPTPTPDLEPQPSPSPSPGSDDDSSLPPTATPPPDELVAVLPLVAPALSDSPPATDTEIVDAEETGILLPGADIALSDSPPLPPIGEGAGEGQGPAGPAITEVTPAAGEEPQAEAEHGSGSSDRLPIWLLGLIIAVAAVVAAGGIVIVLTLRNRYVQ